MTERVNHPAHYGGAHDPFEAIKIIEAYGMGFSFCLGNALKYICRAPHKGSEREDLRKASWYLARAGAMAFPTWPEVNFGAPNPSAIAHAWHLEGPLFDVVVLLCDAIARHDGAALDLAATRLHSIIIARGGA